MLLPDIRRFADENFARSWGCSALAAPCCGIVRSNTISWPTRWAVGLYSPEYRLSIYDHELPPASTVDSQLLDWLKAISLGVPVSTLMVLFMRCLCFVYKASTPCRALVFAFVVVACLPQHSSSR